MRAYERHPHTTLLVVLADRAAPEGFALAVSPFNFPAISSWNARARLKRRCLEALPRRHLLQVPRLSDPH